MVHDHDNGDQDAGGVGGHGGQDDGVGQVQSHQGADGPGWLGQRSHHFICGPRGGECHCPDYFGDCYLRSWKLL